LKERLKGENGTRNEKQERETLDVQVECQEPSETLIEINKSKPVLRKHFRIKNGDLKYVRWKLLYVGTDNVIIWLMSSNLLIQWKPLNRITLCQTLSDPIKRMMPISK
jgi:hypothetical protein